MTSNPAGSYVASLPHWTSSKPIGGIGEAPAQPTRISNSRLLNKLQPLTLHRTSSQNTQHHDHTPNNHSASIQHSLSISASTTGSSSRYTHKKTGSDSLSLHSNHHLMTTSYIDPPTPSRTPTTLINYNQLELPSLIGKSRNRTEKQQLITPLNRSIVSNLSRIPISQQQLTHHHIIPAPSPHHPTLHINSLPDPSILTITTGKLASNPKLITQPKVLNDKPASNHNNNQQQQTHHSYHTNQSATELDQQPLIRLSSQHTHSHPFKPSLSHPQPKTNSNPLNHHQNSTLQSSIPANSTHSHTLPVKPNLTQKPPRKPPHPTFSFEPSGKSFCKYAHPKPHLDATLNSQPPEQPRSNEPKRRNMNNISTPNTFQFPQKHFELSPDASMEVLKERYWNSRQADINPDAQQVWAEIYISRLERQLWKTQADADPSPDCLSFCIPLASNNHPHKPHHRHRRTASASDAGLARPSGSSSHLQGYNQSKTSKRPRFNSTGFLKPLSSAARLLFWYPSSPLDISDGPLPRRPNSSLTRSQSSCVITPYRPDSLAGSPLQNPASTLPLATNSAVVGANSTADFPRQNYNQDRGYRIIQPPTTNQQQLKSFRRRSRSVPDLRRANLYSSASLESTTEITGYPGWVPDELISQTNFSIPQSLINAMFPPASALPANPPCHPSNSNLLSIDSMSQAVRRISSHKNQHHSICATIEVADNSDPCTPSNPPAVPSAPLEPITKGPLHSLPRVIELRPTAIVPLPPPPRKRNLTPTTSIYSLSQNSLNVAAKRSTGETKRSASETKRSTSETKRSTAETKWSITDSMIANVSGATPSDKSVARNRTRPTSFRLSRACSSPPIPPEPLPDLGAGDTLSDPQIQPAGHTFECPQARRRQSSFSANLTSPTCDSAFESAYEHSRVLSQSSSQPCSLGVVDSFIEPQDRPSTSIPESPPLSALYLGPTIEHPLNYTGRHPHNSFFNTIDSSRRSSHSSLCESSHSVIDPDKPINQADLFYQIPASPRRSLIQDYDDLVVKSRQASYGKAGTSPLTTAAKRSGLIDDILAGYAGPREAQMMQSDHLQLENEQVVTETVMDLKVNRSDSRSAVTQTVPNIVDAFEARRSTHVWDKAYNQQY